MPWPAPPPSGAQTPAEREHSAALATALEAAANLDSFPKATLDVYVLVLEAGGSELAVAATAAALAMADAGVEMFDLVCACCVVRGSVERAWRLSRAGLVGFTGGFLCSVLWFLQLPALTFPGPDRFAPCPCPARLPPLQSRMEGRLLLDPTADESYREEGGLLLALMPTANEVRRGAVGGWAAKLQHWPRPLAPSAACA